MQKVVGSSPIIRALRNSLETAGFLVPVGPATDHVDTTLIRRLRNQGRARLPERLLETLIAEASLANKKCRCTCG
jgi:hypothetical protein